MFDSTDRAQVMLRETMDTQVEEAGDVVVFGSGSAGVAAAISAARHGATTTLVDQAGFVGGNLVSSLPIITGASDRALVGGLFEELVGRLKELRAATGDGGDSQVQVDHERLKLVLLEMCRESGVELRLHTMFSRCEVSERRITHAIVEGKGGRRALAAGLFVDATGDADVAFSASVPTEKGRSTDGAMQPMSLMFGVGNIDLERFTAWGGVARLRALYIEVATREGFVNPRRDKIAVHSPPRPRELTFGVTRVIDSDGTDPASLSSAEVEARVQVWEFVDRFLRPHVAGFEEAYVVHTAARIGVRETRRVVGEYVCSEEDVLGGRHFADAVACGASKIDIHNPRGSGNSGCSYPRLQAGAYWTIPYRSLVPLEIDNLLVAGRCFSATHVALGAMRMMAQMLAMGQAAGTAAALCCKHESSPRSLDYSLLRNALVEDGAFLGEPSS